MKIAIITGASSGLGAEFVNEFIRRENDLDEIWIIARHSEVLNSFVQISKKCIPLALDITKEESIQEIAYKLQQSSANIRFLVNNAGVGTIGNLRNMEFSTQTQMIALNCAALTALTTICLPYMQKDSCIINSCSIASFAPNPGMTVYSSTKAYVLSFSKSLRYEEKKNGIHVLAVCPGPMRTAFLDIAGITPGRSKTFDTLPYCDPARVAQIAVKKAVKNKAVYTPRVFFKCYRVLAKVLPHNWLLPFSKT